MITLIIITLYQFILKIRQTSRITNKIKINQYNHKINIRIHAISAKAQGSHTKNLKKQKIRKIINKISLPFTMNTAQGHQISLQKRDSCSIALIQIVPLNLNAKMLIHSISIIKIKIR